MFSLLFGAHIAFTGWWLSRKGDERDKHGYWIIVTYAGVSYAIWALFSAPVFAFLLVHLLAAVVFLAYSTKLTGHIIGLAFCVLVLVDLSVLMGWVPFHRANAIWNVAYADLKGLLSHIILFIVWKAAGDVRKYQSLFRDPLISDRSTDRGLLCLEDEKKATHKT